MLNIKQLEQQKLDQARIRKIRCRSDKTQKYSDFCNSVPLELVLFIEVGLSVEVASSRALSPRFRIPIGTRQVRLCAFNRFIDSPAHFASKDRS